MHIYIVQVIKGGDIMLGAKEGVYGVGYHTTLNGYQAKEENWTSKIIGKMKRHKWITCSVVALISFTILDIVMVHNFFNILQNI